MWKKPELDWKNFAASDFGDLLPEKLQTTKVGHTYALTGITFTLTRSRFGSDFTQAISLLCNFIEI